MLASWYTDQGLAQDVLNVGEFPDPHPSSDEVRVRVRLSGVNPGDTKKREGWLGSAMPFQLVIPHSDGVGYIDEVGAGVSASRIGERVWMYGAQSYRQFGTAAQFVVVPERQAVLLPDGVSDELAASLGIPGITAHQAVFSDGSVNGKAILVQGVLGAVSSLAAQLARWGGADVTGTVRRTADLLEVPERQRANVVALDRADPAVAIRQLIGPELTRIVEVALSDNANLDASIVNNNTIIATYFSRTDRLDLPFSPLLFNNVVLRFLGSDDFSAAAKERAAQDLTQAALEGALTVKVSEVFPLDRIADAHDAVDASPRGRILLQIP